MFEIINLGSDNQNQYNTSTAILVLDLTKIKVDKMYKMYKM